MKNTAIFNFLVITILAIGCTNTSNQQNTGKEEVKIEKSIPKTDLEYRESGKSVIIEAFGALSNALMKEVSANGPASAVQYCNVNAMPMAEKLGRENNVQIKRTSNKIRNPKNKANKLEQMALNRFEAAIEKEKKLEGYVAQDDAGAMYYFHPIMTNGLCLKCHGKNETDVEDATKIALAKLYPNDHAMGYIAGAFRGIWSIKFNN